MKETSRQSSPLDPFLARFLHAIEHGGAGFQPGPETAAMAEQLDLPRAFVEGLLTSARTRGLVKPMYGRGSKIRWNVSPTGVMLIRSQVQEPQRAPDA
jgi:hypothetical protein